MNLESMLKRICFGQPIKGERVKKDYELKHTTTIPGITPRPSEKEWKEEFKVSSQYSRFNPQSNFYTNEKYGDESVSEHNDMLRRVMTGSI